MQTTIKRGDLVKVNGKLAAVVGVPGDRDVPDDHVALWYGDEHADKQGTQHAVAVAWTVPIAYCETVQAIEYKH